MTRPGAGLPAPAPGLRMQVFTSPSRPIGGGRRTFSPTTSTLLLGDRDAVLVDAQFHADDVTALGDLIEGTGRRLTTIVVTHGHGDHYFGSGRLAERFPGARFVATPAVAADITARWDEEIATFTALFGDRLALPGARPTALPGDTIPLEGHEVRAVELAQADISPCAVVHVPSLGAVVAGDAAYDRVHPMLGLGGPDQWARWTASIDAIEALAPRVVVAGHRPPEVPDEDPARVLGTTRAYIRDFAAAAGSAASAQDLVAAMQQRYPDHGNLTTLLFSARAAVPAAPAPSRAPGASGSGVTVPGTTPVEGSDHA